MKQQNQALDKTNQFNPNSAASYNLDAYYCWPEPHTTSHYGWLWKNNPQLCSKVRLTLSVLQSL